MIMPHHESDPNAVLSFLIKRKKESYDFMFNKNAKPSWDNNFKNNMVDTLCLYEGTYSLLEGQCQSVSNSPTGRYEDTVAPGTFGLKLFIERRMYYCDVHGIVNAHDMEGQYIDFDSVENNDKSRWLMHDTYKTKPALRYTMCTHAWSSGCFIIHPNFLNKINQRLVNHGFKSGDIIGGTVVEY